MSSKKLYFPLAFIARMIYNMISLKNKIVKGGYLMLKL